MNDSPEAIRAFAADISNPGCPWPHRGLISSLGSLEEVDLSSASGVEAFRQLSGPIAAATVIDTFRSEYANGGVDQFVWNHGQLSEEVVRAFRSVGATRTADLIAQLAGALGGEQEAGIAFADYRSKVSGPLFGPWLEFDPVQEVEDAILVHAQAHPEQFVQAPR